MTERSEYRIHTDVKFSPLTLIDVPGLVKACEDPWFNQTLCRVNDSVVRLGIVKGEFHWHHHDREDELFVLEGTLLIDLEKTTVELGPHQGYTIPNGTRHRTRAPEKVVMLMLATQGVTPVGDASEEE